MAAELPRHVKKYLDDMKVSADDLPKKALGRLPVCLGAR